MSNHCRQVHTKTDSEVEEVEGTVNCDECREGLYGTIERQG